MADIVFDTSEIERQLDRIASAQLSFRDQCAIALMAGIAGSSRLVMPAELPTVISHVWKIADMMAAARNKSPT